ncbi:MAG TPA: SUMF1/EgtB/PvdO family nonheme iron enzyme [Nitrospirota bacterium]|nr:SUMF1/EgtB/PvdO family nonheme iron enzyme [Nitrospirota bacterium]
MKKLLLLILTGILAFVVPAAFAERGVKVSGKGDAKAVSFKTNYYALVIGNNDYQQLPKLKTAVNDAREVERVLREKYGFRTKLLTNASRKNILGAINDFRRKLTEKDSFLVYYAGHGYYDKTADKGYWLPIDAAKDDDSEWIIADDITSNIKRILAAHVLIVSDSCYSGALIRSVSPEISAKGGRASFLAKMMERQSRTLMASGGNEPVADAGGRGNHSVFASALLTALNDPDEKTFTAEELFHGRVKTIVAGRSDQVPQYSNIRNSGDEGGDFVFQLAQAVEGGEEKTATDAGSYEAPSPAERHTSSGNSYTDPETGMQFVFVQGGCYQMGDTSGDGDAYKRTGHEVCVNDFYIGKFDVTQAQWRAIMGNNPSYFSNCGDNCPVENISWNDAQDYIRILNQRTGKNYRLPTEAEWEYAARSGGKSEMYAGTSSESELGEYAWYKTNSGDQTHPVGQKRSNGLGIYDMSGNVWQWVNDWYDNGYYGNSSRDNPEGPGTGSNRVLRGGCWSNAPKIVRAVHRFSHTPDFRNNAIGFRLSRTP